VENLLLKTSSLGRTSNGAETLQARDLHWTIFDDLLHDPPMQDVLHALTEQEIPGVEDFLRERCATDRFAGACLVTYYTHRAEDCRAAGVLLHMAESSNPNSSLEERIEYLQGAKMQVEKAMPNSKEAEEVKIRLDVAQYVQLPLLRELELILKDERVTEKWKGKAEECCKKVQCCKACLTFTLGPLISASSTSCWP